MRREGGEVRGAAGGNGAKWQDSGGLRVLKDARVPGGSDVGCEAAGGSGISVRFRQGRCCRQLRRASCGTSRAGRSAAWRLVLGTWAFSAAAGESGAAAARWSVWGSGDRSGETNLPSVWRMYRIPSPDVRTLCRSKKTTWGKEGWRTEVRSDPVESLMNIITLLETDWRVTE